MEHGDPTALIVMRICSCKKSAKHRRRPSQRPSAAPPGISANIDNDVHDRQGERDIVIFEPFNGSPHAGCDLSRAGVKNRTVCRPVHAQIAHRMTGAKDTGTDASGINLGRHRSPIRPSMDKAVHYGQGERDIVMFEPLTDSPRTGFGVFLGTHLR
jgi:hypothetical protein